MSKAPPKNSATELALPFNIAQLKSQQASLRYRGQLSWVHWLVLGVSIVITTLLWRISGSALEKQQQIRFEREAERAIHDFNERISEYENILLAGVATMQSHGGQMTQQEWRSYYEFLQLEKRTPGLNGIGVTSYLDKKDLPAFVKQMQEQIPNYKTHPDQTLDISIPTRYMEPIEKNAGAKGLDFAFEVERLTAANYARSTGTTQISSPITLKDGNEETPGLIFFAPYYNTNSAKMENWDTMRRESESLGFVFSPLIVRNIAKGVLNFANPMVSVTIYDKDKVLYRDDTPDRQKDPQYKRIENTPIHGRIWRYVIESTPEFEKNAGIPPPTFVLLSGLSLDAMMFALFLLMSRSSRHILTMADGMTDNLSEQARQLSENNRDLKNFAHVVSHDLKTPIRNIHSLTQILEEDLADYLASNDAQMNIKNCLNGLREQAIRSQNLITGILEYSIQNSKDTPRSEVDTHELLLSIAEQLKLSDKQFSLKGDFPILYTNKTGLSQVLTNLVDNAIKYNPDKTNATVMVSVTQEADCFRFSVTDNGPGIDPRFRDHIFQPFTTLQTVTNIHSSGIGLSIVQRAVERQGGQIALDSSIGSGSTFHFTWPANEEKYYSEPLMKRA